VTTTGPFPRVGLLGASRYLPGEPIDNVAALGVLGRDGDPDQQAFAAKGIEQSLGLRQRHWTHRPGDGLDHGAEQSSLDLATEAARRALADASVDAEDLGLIVATTSTPHRMTSTLAAPVGAALGTTCPAMDLRTGCSAALFALQTGASLVQAADRPVLVVAAETFSKVIPSQHKMAVLSLGDGAAALVLGRREGASVHRVFLKTDGRLAGLITTTGALPPTLEEIARGGYVLSGAPEELAATLPAKYGEALDSVMGEHDLYVPHQTSLPLIREVAAAAGIDATKVYSDGVGDHANIGSAGWVAGLAEAWREGRLRRDETVLVAAVGGGMSWGAARWTI